jgi:hypothetical protein
VPEFLSLELVVKVYNINHGHNTPLIQGCKTLEGYSAFIAKAREWEERVAERDEALKLAVKDCIEQGILKEFLEAHASEVLNMLLTEWNWDDALAVREEEGVERGREEGREEGREQVAKNALLEGVPVELVQKITGLDGETIRGIASTLGTETAGE